MSAYNRESLLVKLRAAGDVIGLRPNDIPIGSDGVARKRCTWCGQAFCKSYDLIDHLPGPKGECNGAYTSIRACKICGLPKARNAVCPGCTLEGKVLPEITATKQTDRQMRRKP